MNRLSLKRRQEREEAGVSPFAPTLSRKAPMKRGGRIKPSNTKRRGKEWARAYGSEERVLWVRWRPCVVCRRGPCENAHVQTGGAARKADARHVVPLCDRSQPVYAIRVGPAVVWIPAGGCHSWLHALGAKSFQEATGVDLNAAAAETEAAWQAHSSRPKVIHHGATSSTISRDALDSAETRRSIP